VNSSCRLQLNRMLSHFRVRFFRSRTRPNKSLERRDHQPSLSLIFYEYISFLQGWLEGKGLREEKTS
jgi:hypothetical protein